MNDIDKFLKRKTLRKGTYIGKGQYPEHSKHWLNTIYFTVDFSKRRAWVFGNFFCVEEVGLAYLQTYFHSTVVTDTKEQSRIFKEVIMLRNKQNGRKEKQGSI